MDKQIAFLNILIELESEIYNHYSTLAKIEKEKLEQNPNHIKVPTRSILFQYSFAIQDMIKVFEKGPSI